MEVPSNSAPPNLRALRNNLQNLGIGTTSKLPSSYIEVSKAGSGEFGTVYYCLSADSVGASRFFDSGSAKRTYELACELAAIKITKPLERKELNQEVETLKAIRKQVRGYTAEQRFFYLIEWDVENPEAPWMVTSTLPMCSSMTGLWQQFEQMPEEFIWLVYVQLLQALDFLHNVCDPPIAHGDLHRGNVMIGFPDPNSLGLPEVKVIDFGFSTFVIEGTEVAMDRVKNDTDEFLFILISLMDQSLGYKWDADMCDLYVENRSPDNSESMIQSFYRALNEALRARGSVEPADLRGLWDEFGDFAIQQVACISEASKKQIQDAILGKTKQQYDARIEKISEILEEFKE